MFTKVETVETLKEVWIEMFLNNTDKVTKVTKGSVLNGVAFGCAKTGQKVLKDQALIESRIFPESAYGQYLDNYAQRRGVAPRFTALGSSTYVRIVGDPGTTYTAGIHIFNSRSGVKFDLEANITIPAIGFTYTKLRSQTVGEQTNVDALTINTVSPAPTGHKYVINEYQATGGIDNEDDDTFRQRIMESINVLSRGTISMFEQVFNKINNNVLRVFFQGYNSQGQAVLAIMTQNGANLSNSELDEILNKGQRFFSLSELQPDGFNGFGIQLKNITWYPIDISCRLDLHSGYDADQVRKEIQIAFNKYIDYRYWQSRTQKAEWDEFLDAVKNTIGVKYVYDNFFFPRVDLTIPRNQMPRIRGFLMLDANGNIIINSSGTLNPIFYPFDKDFSFQSTVLKSI